MLIARLRLAFEHHAVSLRKDPDRMRWEKLRPIVSRANHTTRDLEHLFGSHFGQEVLEFASRCEPSDNRAEFENIPQRLRLLASWAQTIYRKTSHGKRPLYDDALADLVVYVEVATKEGHDKEIAALVGFARGDDDRTENPYNGNDFAGWKFDHKKNLGHARLRMTKAS
jgi:hypothetical protein